MLRTNTIKYRENIKIAIEKRLKRESIKTIDDLLLTFNDEQNYEANKKRYPNIQTRVAEWLSCGGGLGFIYSYDIDDFAAECHGISEIPENKRPIVRDNFHNHMAYFILKFANEKTIL
jgi:hypothetical protein